MRKPLSCHLTVAATIILTGDVHGRFFHCDNPACTPLFDTKGKVTLCVSRGPTIGCTTIILLSEQSTVVGFTIIFSSPCI
jgi:hypothetical protein